MKAGDGGSGRERQDRAARRLPLPPSISAHSPQLPVDVVDEDQDARPDGAGAVGREEEIGPAREEVGSRGRDDGRDSRRRRRGRGRGRRRALSAVRDRTGHVQGCLFGAAEDGLEAAAGEGVGRREKKENVNWLGRTRRAAGACLPCRALEAFRSQLLPRAGQGVICSSPELEGDGDHW